jgi:hypothetical protein
LGRHDARFIDLGSRTFPVASCSHYLIAAHTAAEVREAAPGTGHHLIISSDEMRAA